MLKIGESQELDCDPTHRHLTYARVTDGFENYVNGVMSLAPKMTEIDD